MPVVRWGKDQRQRAKDEGKVLACLAVDDRELEPSLLGKATFHLLTDRKTARKILEFATQVVKREHKKLPLAAKGAK